MQPLPLPLRLAAGLVATAIEEVQGLPKKLIELPVTAVSQVLQTSMRMQQRVTELAIKGDQALGGLREVPETPTWARFDEDEFNGPFGAPSGFDEPAAAEEWTPPRPPTRSVSPILVTRDTAGDTTDTAPPAVPAAGAGGPLGSWDGTSLAARLGLSRGLSPCGEVFEGTERSWCAHPLLR